MGNKKDTRNIFERTIYGMLPNSLSNIVQGTHNASNGFLNEYSSELNKNVNANKYDNEIYESQEQFKKATYPTMRDDQKPVEMEKPAGYDEYIKDKEEKQRQEEQNKSDKGFWEKLFNLSDADDSSPEDIIFKPTEALTENEAQNASKFAWFDTNDQDLKDKINEKVAAFYSLNYGDQSVKYDAAGRMIDSGAKRDIPLEPTLIRTADGYDLDKAKQQLIFTLADKTPRHSVQSLQRGLNLTGLTPQLKEDGDFGSKTKLGLKSSLAKQGLKSTINALNLGNFETMMENNRRRPIDNEALRTGISGLFGNDRNAAQKIQSSINISAQDLDGYEKLKEDNDIGPKTTEAFNRIKDEREEALKKNVRESLFPKMIV